MIRVQSVLIADEVEQNCIDILKADGVKAIKKTQLTKDQLIVELLQYDAVIVRSATKVSNIFL
uniref:Phosphoglycerate dehydrogenase n=1 Tax=Parascaris equorum TaxID=6256 RepID=A0A914R8T9_PAREQ